MSRMSIPTTSRPPHVKGDAGVVDNYSDHTRGVNDAAIS